MKLTYVRAFHSDQVSIGVRVEADAENLLKQHGKKQRPEEDAGEEWRDKRVLALQRHMGQPIAQHNRSAEHDEREQRRHVKASGKKQL